MSAALDELGVKVGQIASGHSSVATGIQNLQAQIAANTVTPADVDAKLQPIIDQLNAMVAALNPPPAVTPPAA